MTDIALRRRLAGHLMQTLEVGTGKFEEEVVDELFLEFGVDWKMVDASVSKSIPDRTKVLRHTAADILAAAAPTAEQLLNVVASCGGRFISMLDEIYKRLSYHSATTSGSAETFQLKRGDVDETHITISPAFLKQVHRLIDLVQHTPVGAIDEAKLRSFTLWDNGVSYGHWPVDEHEPGDRLVNAVLDLSWIGPLIQRNQVADAHWIPVYSLWQQAREAAEALITAAEAVVKSHTAHIASLAALDVCNTERRIFKESPPNWLTGDNVKDWAKASRLEEIERYRAKRSLGVTACPGFVHNVEELQIIGLNDKFEPVRQPVDEYYAGSGVSALAGFVAMWKLGLWATLHRTGPEDDLLGRPETRSDWLRWVISACHEAIVWLTTDILDVTHEVDTLSRIQAMEELLDLPFWKQRDLLYEIWILCATLDACQETGWATELCGLSSVDGSWVLSNKPTQSPVAKLRLVSDPCLTLDVWREPLRKTEFGDLTPDLTVSTPPPYVRDLLVVEAKDRIKMSVGSETQLKTASNTPTWWSKGALGVAHRYARGLQPSAVWICNHCNFRQETTPDFNYGNVWTNIYLASRFHPANVPGDFKASVKSALKPPEGPSLEPSKDPDGISGLVLVVDMTASMEAALAAILKILSEIETEPFENYRAILFSDHGDCEPFLIRKIGPFAQAKHLSFAIQEQPRGHGEDREEAMEDAMERCRELVEDIGPQTILVITDAPPHKVSFCPYKIDFAAEVRALMDSGCNVQVSSNWLSPSDTSWDSFLGNPRFQMEPLEKLVVAWTL